METKSSKKGGAGPGAPVEKAGIGVEDLMDEDIESVRTVSIAKDGRIHLGRENDGAHCVIIKPIDFSSFRIEGAQGRLLFSLTHENEVLVRQISDGRVYVDYNMPGQKVLVIVLKGDNDE